MNGSTCEFMERERIVNKLIHILCIVVIFVVCIWYLGMQQRIRVVDDEFAYWGIAAQLAGLDWSGALSKTGYYSYGYSLILVPLYWLIRAGMEVVVVYRIAIVMNAVFLCLSFCLAKAAAKRIFSDINIRFIDAASLVSVLFLSNVTQSGCAWTEVYLAFMFWCCLYCMVRVSEMPTAKWICLALLAAANMFAIHMRSIGVVLVTVAVVLLRLLLGEDKQKVRKIAGTLAIVVVLAVIVFAMRSYVKNDIYQNNSATVTNDFSGQMQKLKSMLSVAGMVDFLFSLLGKMFYIGIATYCIGIFSVFVCAREVIQEGIISIKTKYFTSNWYVNLFVFGSAAGAVGVDAVFKIIRYYSEGIAVILKDSVIYGRYVDFIIGPLILMGILLAGKQFEKYKAEAFLSIFVIIGCGIAVQKMWDILFFYNGTESPLRRTAIPGITYMVGAGEERLAFLLITYAVCGFSVFCAVMVCRNKKWKRRLAIILCGLASLGGAVIGNGDIKDGIIEKSNKLKNVDSVAVLLDGLDDNVDICYVTRNGKVNYDMKILQWELPLRTIRVQDAADESIALQENTVYLAESTDNKLNAALCRDGEYLYDSGTIAVFVRKNSETGYALEEVAKVAAACANPLPIEVNLADAVAEFAYQKANGCIYLSEQRTEAYLTDRTGVTLDDGVYEFQIELELSYYEGGTIGYITVTNDSGTYLDTRVLEESDFDRNGKGCISVLIPVRDYEEPIIGVYAGGNGAMKVTGMTCTQVCGNVAAELGREGEWQKLADILGELYESDKLPIGYVDSDGSAQSGFMDFSQVNIWLPTEISCYHTGDQMKYMTVIDACYLIVEKTEDMEEYSFINSGKIEGESEHYYILLVQ